MIKDKKRLIIAIVVFALLIVIGAASTFFISNKISAENLDRVDSQISSMVEEAGRDQYLMNQEQLDVLETIRIEQAKAYKDGDIKALLGVKEKIRDFSEGYPDIIISSARSALTAIELPAGANQDERNKLAGIRDEALKSISDSGLGLGDKVELINAGIKQTNDLVITVTNRLKEESRRAAAAIKVVERKPVVSSTPAISAAQLNVSVIRQRPELPSGCEATSLTMLLNYIGVSVTKIQIVQEMPYHSSNPDLGFVGSPYESSGYTIYPPALMEIMQKYAGSAVNLTGKGTSAIRNSIDSGKPVIVWGKLSGFYLHCVLVTGYDKDGFYFNDPWTGVKNKYITNSAFEIAWKAIGYRAMSY